LDRSFPGCKEHHHPSCDLDKREGYAKEMQNGRPKRDSQSVIKNHIRPPGRLKRCRLFLSWSFVRERKIGAMPIGFTIENKEMNAYL